MARLLAAFIFLLLAAGVHATEGDRTLTIGGATRSYRLHLPNNRAPDEPAPLVVLFHGGGGNAAIGERMSGMDAKSDREGFIAVYPNGTGPRIDLFLTWNTWRCCGAALDRRADDVGFTRAMVEAVGRGEHLPPHRTLPPGGVQRRGGGFFRRPAAAPPLAP